VTTSSSKEFVVRFELKDIVSGGADDVSRALLDTWSRNNGRICDEISAYTEYLTILDGRPDTCDSPKVLFYGPKSLLARRLGADSTDRPRVAKTTFHNDYRRLCSNAYFDTAVGGLPVFDMVHSPQALRTGNDKPVTYHRLLLPISSDNGVRLTLCYSLDLTSRRYPADEKRSKQPLGAGIQQSINLNRPGSLAGYPT
jgi:hypothetical protein